MKKNIRLFLLSAAFLLCFGNLVFSQTLIKRTTYKNETFEFGAGGTISIIGAPQGSVSIEGWSKNEIELTAEIENQAMTEADLTKLAEVNGIIFDDVRGHLRIISVGTHDKDYMKRVGKKFPKNLLGMPFKVDYKLKVPKFCDIEVDGGNGDFSISGVDGTMNIKFLNSNAKIELVGGAIAATIGAGTVDVSIPTRNWRGRFVDIQLAKGNMNVKLPFSLNAEVNASVLRIGKIENSFTELKPRTKIAFTEKSMTAKAGNGGIPLNFTVGDGDLNISQYKKPE